MKKIKVILAKIKIAQYCTIYFKIENFRLKLNENFYSCDFILFPSKTCNLRKTKPDKIVRNPTK